MMKYRYVYYLSGVIMGGIMLWAIFKPGTASWVALACWLPFQIGEFWYGRRLRRFNQKQATVMWSLADQLGLTARDLKRLAGKYGELDWQNTHPENMQFYPSQKVMTSVIRQLKQERNLREMALKRHGNVIE